MTVRFVPTEYIMIPLYKAVLVTCDRLMSRLRKVQGVISDVLQDLTENTRHEMNTSVTPLGRKFDTKLLNSNSHTQSKCKVHRDLYTQSRVTNSEDQRVSLLTTRKEEPLDLPIKVKNADGVIYDNCILIGGGYTGNSKQDSTVYVYNSKFGIWSSLPECPLKWFSMAVFKEQLVLIGGKEVGGHTLNYTNKVAVLNKNKKWDFSLPPMRFARSSPIVITSDIYLIVAGGNKGSLDYSMEIFDSTTQQWIVGPPLPCKCLMHTSAVVGNTWYLMNESDGNLFCASIPILIESVLKRNHIERVSEAKTQYSPLTDSYDIWQQIRNRPPTKPFRIVSSKESLLSLSRDDISNTINVAVCDSSGAWLHAHCGKLPESCSNASVLSGDHQLMMFGGDGANKKYSQRVLKFFLSKKVPDAL